jgi:hypothetical protein
VSDERRTAGLRGVTRSVARMPVGARGGPGSGQLAALVTPQIHRHDEPIVSGAVQADIVINQNTGVGRVADTKSSRSPAFRNTLHER